jgi:hypothetical protein
LTPGDASDSAGADQADSVFHWVVSRGHSHWFLKANSKIRLGEEGFIQLRQICRKAIGAFQSACANEAIDLDT